MDYLYDYEEELRTPLTREDYDHALDHLRGLVKDVYTTGSVEDLEFHLQEVLFAFGEKFPSETLKIMKKPTVEEESNDRMLKAWVGYTRAYAEMMTK